MIDDPKSEWLDGIQSAIGAIVAAGTGIYAIWQGFRFSLRKIKEVYRTIVKFADSLEAITDLTRQVAVIEATQRCYTAINRQPMWRSDIQGHCVEANAALLGLIGITFDDIRGAGWAHYIHEEDRDRVVKEWQEAVTSRSRFRSEFRFRRPDNNAAVSVESRAYPIISASGDLLGFMGTDIAEH